MHTAWSGDSSGGAVKVRRCIVAGVQGTEWTGQADTGDGMHHMPPQVTRVPARRRCMRGWVTSNCGQNCGHGTGVPGGA